MPPHIKIRVGGKKIKSFVTEPVGFCIEIDIGNIRFQTNNIWLREPDAMRRAGYIQDRIVKARWKKDAIIERKGTT